MKKICGILSILLLSVALFANGTQDRTTKSTGATETESATVSPADIKTGGTLQIITGQSSGVIGYTPEITSNSHIPFLRCSYDSLLMFDTVGSLSPVLASAWTTDPDKALITFSLRKGIKFSDGTDFNAAAVKWNIAEYQKVGRIEVANIASVECPDDYTVVLHLKKWISSSLESIGFFVYYMSPTTVGKNGVDWVRQNSCGTGPFIVESFERGVEVTYKKNPLYWQKGKPYLDSVKFTIMSDDMTMENSFLAEEADMLMYASADQIKDMAGQKGIVIEKNDNGQGAMGMGIIPNSNDKNSPFSDSRVRQAFCYAINSDAIVKSLSYGLYATTNQWAVPGSVTYNPDVKGYPYNPDKAKALLKEAGYVNGFNTTISVISPMKNWAVAIANNLTKVGILTKVEIIDEAKNNFYMANGWNGIMLHYSSIGPDLGLYMGRHLDVNGAYYAKGIQHPQDCLDLLNQIRVARDDKTKIADEWNLQSLIYDKYALFGKPVCVSLVATFKKSYVQGDDFGLRHTSTWSPENTWLDK